MEVSRSKPVEVNSTCGSGVAQDQSGAYTSWPGRRQQSMHESSISGTERYKSRWQTCDIVCVKRVFRRGKHETERVLKTESMLLDANGDVHYEFVIRGLYI